MGVKGTFLPFVTLYPTKIERQRETTDSRRAKALAASQELPDATLDGLEDPGETSIYIQSQPME